MKKAEGGSKGIQRWLKRQQRRLSGKMLGIGDGANDVAMIQAADVGIGIMGKEGRQVTTQLVLMLSAYTSSLIFAHQGLCCHAFYCLVHVSGIPCSAMVSRPVYSLSSWKAGNNS